MRSRLQLFAILILLIMSGCAFPATKQGMTAWNYVNPNPIGEKIFVKESTGGSTTLPFWTSEIGNPEFTEAVKESLIRSKTFSSLASNWGESWSLEIEILDVDQPLFGLTLAVLTKVKYTLFLKERKVYETLIDSRGQATMKRSFWAIKRLRLANEDSAKNNIQAFLKELSSQDLN